MTVFPAAALPMESYPLRVGYDRARAIAPEEAGGALRPLPIAVIGVAAVQ